MTMMHMPWVLVVLIVFLVVILGGALLAIRVLAARTDRQDHPDRGQANAK